MARLFSVDTNKGARHGSSSVGQVCTTHWPDGNTNPEEEEEEKGGGSVDQDYSDRSMSRTGEW